MTGPLITTCIAQFFHDSPFPYSDVLLVPAGSGVSSIALAGRSATQIVFGARLRRNGSMNRSLQLLRMSVVLLFMCLAGVQSASGQMAALHGPIGRPSQPLSPGAASQLVEQTPTPATPVGAEVLAPSSNEHTADAETVPPEPAVESAFVLRSGDDPASDQAVDENSAARPSPAVVAGERYLSDPRAVAMLSHGISRNVVVRRIALLSRLQEAAGRHRFAPQVAVKSVAATGVTVPQQPLSNAAPSSVCPYVDQKEQARLALQVPPEPPLAAIAEVVETKTPEAAVSRPNVPLAGTVQPGTVQPSQRVPELTSQVSEFPPEPGAPRLGYFIAVIDAPEEPSLGYFIAVIDGLEDTIGDESAAVTIASDPRPIGTGIATQLAFEETPPEPARDVIRSHSPAVALAIEEARSAPVAALQQDLPVDLEDALIEEVETPLAVDAETLGNEEDAAIVAEPEVATFDAFDGDAFDGIGFDDGVLVDDPIRPVQKPATTLQSNGVGASPFPGEPSPPAIAPAIGRAFRQAWEKTFQRQ